MNQLNLNKVSIQDKVNSQSHSVKAQNNQKFFHPMMTSYDPKNRTKNEFSEGINKGNIIPQNQSQISQGNKEKTQEKKQKQHSQSYVQLAPFSEQAKLYKSEKNSFRKSLDMMQDSQAKSFFMKISDSLNDKKIKQKGQSQEAVKLYRQKQNQFDIALKHYQKNKPKNSKNSCNSMSYSQLLPHTLEISQKGTFKSPKAEQFQQCGEANTEQKHEQTVIKLPLNKQKQILQKMVGVPKKERKCVQQQQQGVQTEFSSDMTNFEQIYQEQDSVLEATPSNSFLAKNQEEIDKILGSNMNKQTHKSQFGQQQQQQQQQSSQQSFKNNKNKKLPVQGQYDRGYINLNQQYSQKSTLLSYANQSHKPFMNMYQFHLSEQEDIQRENIANSFVKEYEDSKLQEQQQTQENQSQQNEEQQMNQTYYFNFERKGSSSQNYQSQQQAYNQKMIKNMKIKQRKKNKSMNSLLNGEIFLNKEDKILEQNSKYTYSNNVSSNIFGSGLKRQQQQQQSQSQNVHTQEAKNHNFNLPTTKKIVFDGQQINSNSNSSQNRDSSPRSPKEISQMNFYNFTKKKKKNNSKIDSHNKSQIVYNSNHNNNINFQQFQQFPDKLFQNQAFSTINNNFKNTLFKKRDHSSNLLNKTYKRDFLSDSHLQEGGKFIQKYKDHTLDESTMTSQQENSKIYSKYNHLELENQIRDSICTTTTNNNNQSSLQGIKMPKIQQNYNTVGNKYCQNNL